jgi:hypothetical protein
MSDDQNRDSQINETEDPADEKIAKQFMLRVFPAVFEKAILEASDDKERHERAAKFAGSPILNFEVIKDLFGYILRIDTLNRKLLENQWQKV